MSHSLPPYWVLWMKKGRKHQGALPFSAADSSLLKTETHAIHPMEWSPQRPLKGEEESQPGLPRESVFAAQTHGEKLCPQTQRWKGPEVAGSWEQGKRRSDKLLLLHLKGSRGKRAAFKMSPDNECYITPIAEVSVRCLGREGRDPS